MLALLTDEQEMLKQTAAQLASSAGVPSPSDLVSVDRAKAWAALSDSGFLALRVRDEADVPMASGVEVMLVCEAFGTALAPLPYLGGIVAAELMSRAGVPDDWLEGLTSGETRYGLLMTPDLARLARIGELDGAVAFDADDAAYALAWSGPSDAPVLARVDLAAGFAPAGAADLTRSLLRVSDPGGVVFDSVDRGLAPENRGGWLALALVATSADTIGVMSSALTRAVDYAKERVQYGVKIGSFQAIQHMCADAFVHIEASASLNRYAAWAVDALPGDEALLAARVAKAYSSSVARDVTETVMQVFGGIGQTWEHVAHLHTRRALTDRALFGDESHHLLHIADARLGA